MEFSDICPSEFEFSYGHELRLLSPRFELKDDKFVEPFPYSDKGTPLEINPTEEQWIEFWKKMDEIDIWNWKEHYEPTDCMVLDGERWEIKIVLGDSIIKSIGSNAYPDLNPENATRKLSPTFKKFLKAFKNLTGIDMLKEKRRSLYGYKRDL